MAVTKFIPQIWSAQFLKYLEKALVYGQDGIVNRDHEGEIKNQGDTVKVHDIGEITVSDYTRNTDINPPETLTDVERLLVIDQAKYFNFQIDDVDAAQVNPKLMGRAMERSAYTMREVIDRYIAAMYVQVAAGNTIGDDTTPIVLSTPDMAYELLVDLGTKLDEANIPSVQRSAIIPPWFHGLIQKDDRFVKAGTTRTDEVLRNGEVGEAAGFRLLKSNNVPNTAGARYKIQASTPWARSFAMQITETKAYEPERRFAEAVKGLNVYGAKVLEPKAMAVATVSKS
ncbi:hypothetical protein [Amycolatopsis sp. cmx-4-54]|uniref:phage major capsid protein n=1 Tax=Amycolatopsis sp. cmx-4-54 TaxID=2790936 RepID=UPI003978E094